MAGKRIVVVGGGSQFAIGLSESFVDYAHDLLQDATVVLLDIQEPHLQIVFDYAIKLARSTGAQMTFEQTTDRRRAFDGADFVLTTFRPGSHEQQLQDEEIPPKHGLQGNETVGIGGIFMACRVVPLLREMCADGQELCPDAQFVNYTNPTQYVADAVRRISDLKFISLCDGYVKTPLYLAQLLQVDPAAGAKVHVAYTNDQVFHIRPARTGRKLTFQVHGGVQARRLEQLRQSNRTPLGWYVLGGRLQNKRRCVGVAIQMSFHHVSSQAGRQRHVDRAAKLPAGQCLLHRRRRSRQPTRFRYLRVGSQPNPTGRRLPAFRKKRLGDNLSLIERTGKDCLMPLGGIAVRIFLEPQLQLSPLPGRLDPGVAEVHPQIRDIGE